MTICHRVSKMFHSNVYSKMFHSNVYSKMFHSHVLPNRSWSQLADSGHLVCPTRWTNHSRWWSSVDPPLLPQRVHPPAASPDDPSPADLPPAPHVPQQHRITGQFLGEISQPWSAGLAHFPLPTLHGAESWQKPQIGLRRSHVRHDQKIVIHSSLPQPFHWCDVPVRTGFRPIPGYQGGGEWAGLWHRWLRPVAGAGSWSRDRWWCGWDGGCFRATEDETAAEGIQREGTATQPLSGAGHCSDTVWDCRLVTASFFSPKK